MKIAIGYRTKLLLAISAISILMLAFMTFSRIFLMEDVLAERTLTRLETIGNILRNDIQQSLQDNDYDNMRNTVVVTAAQSHIEFVSVVDAAGQVLFSSPDGNLIGKPNPHRDSRDIKSASTTYVKSFSMTHRNTPLGAIQIGFSLATLNRDVRTTILRTLVLNIISLACVLLVAWFVAGKLLSPIIRMKKVSEKYARGDFSERLTATSNDVIGELEDALNNMAIQLNELTANLNDRVTKATRQLTEKTRELEDSNQRLKELDQLKSEFVSIVSHELRTPLTSIIGFSKTLMKVKVSPEQTQEYLAIIESEGKRLATLIDEFLDISRIEAGKLDVHRLPCDVEHVVRDTISAIVVPTGIHVRVETVGSSYRALADPNKIRQVMMNIVHNALKYAPCGSVVAVSVHELGDAIQVSVSDSGPGIDSTDIDRIFDKFYRGRDEVARRNRGSGLGLAIARGIIEMHGGRIWAESTAGHGCSFIFALPKLVQP